VAATESADVDLRGLTRGFQAGFNYQLANGLVVGLEGDLSWLKHQKTQKALATEGAALAAAGWLQASTQYELEWMTTLRGRAGFAFDRLFVYGTGGVAWLKEIEERAQYWSTSASQSAPAGTSTTGPMFREQAIKTRVGWTLGGGAEYALTNNWSLKSEYSYAHFGQDDFLFPGARAGVTSPYSYQTIVGYIPDPRPPRPGQPPRPDIPVYQTTNVPGTYNTVNGRKASNSLDLHAIKMGLNYRF
jgi:hemoglobin/transferrin/lactoferrin receptor protein